MTAAAPARHVLVVDDDPDILLMMQIRLERDGYRVSTADDGPAAMTAVAADRPDMILLDWMMPGPSGLDVCRALRAAGDGVPVVLITAKADLGAAAAAREAGVSSYVTKPFSLQVLSDHVAAVLADPLRPLDPTTGPVRERGGQAPGGHVDDEGWRAERPWHRRGAEGAARRLEQRRRRG